LDRPTTGPQLPTGSVSHMSYINMHLKEAVLCEACDCLSDFSVCVRVWVCFVSCMYVLGWVLKYINFLSVVEGMKSWQKLDAANASGLLSVPAFCV